MPPEGYEERRRQEIVNDFLKWIEQGRSKYKRLSAVEQVKRIEMERLKKHLAKSMMRYGEEYPN
jgi:acylphosphatase